MKPASRSSCEQVDQRVDGIDPDTEAMIQFPVGSLHVHAPVEKRKR